MRPVLRLAASGCACLRVDVSKMCPRPCCTAATLAVPRPTLHVSVLPVAVAGPAAVLTPPEDARPTTRPPWVHHRYFKEIP